MQNIIQQRFQEHMEVAQAVMQSDILEQIERVAEVVKKALADGHKVLFCGNGGSAADSQHLAAEFVGRFQKERRGLPAIALTVDTSILTAVSNDYGYDKVFVRQVEALAQAADGGYAQIHGYVHQRVQLSAGGRTAVGAADPENLAQA